MTIKLAIIGTGGMAKVHVDRFKDIKDCRVVACCDIVPGRARAFAAERGIPAAYEDMEEMLCQEKLDAVSVVAVDRAHAPVSLLAIRHGLHVLCEKPLATCLKDARCMAEAARRKGVITGVNFSYRNNTATQQAARIVAAGKLGRIIHVEGSYLQSWLASRCWGDWRKGEGWLWRLSTRHGSAGVLGDLGVHLFDFAGFIVGGFSAVQCELKTFDKGVKKIGSYVFEANDSMIATVRFRNGAIGTLHSSRWAVGHANTVALRVYGDRGALDINLDRPQPETLRVCLGKDVDKNLWKPVKCLPAPNMHQRFISAIKNKRQGQAGFDTGAQVQSYLEASFNSASKSGRWVEI